MSQKMRLGEGLGRDRERKVGGTARGMDASIATRTSIPVVVPRC